MNLVFRKRRIVSGTDMGNKKGDVQRGREGGRVEGSEEVRYGGVTEGGGKKEGSEECKE